MTDNERPAQFIFTDFEGVPTLSADRATIDAAGARLGAAMALAANDPNAQARILNDYAREHQEAIVGVLIVAVETLADLLHKAVPAAEFFGDPLGCRLSDMAAGRPTDPQAAPVRPNRRDRRRKR